MRLADFRTLVERLHAEVPPAYLDGILEVAVSAKAVPHPVRAEIYTMGECIPVEWSGSGADLQSRVVLYHGSFAALAALADPGDFDWRGEAWETLTHELRHHLEWRANTARLEAYDWAAEQNFARHEGEDFDPVFYRDGDRVAAGIFKVDDDFFLESRSPAPGRAFEVVWHGRRYQAPPPADLRPPAFLTLQGLDEPPPGEAVLVVPRRLSVWSLFRAAPAVQAADLPVRAADA